MRSETSRWRRIVFFLALASGLLLLCACSDTSCPSCVDGVDPVDLVDPVSLGDGTGYPGAAWTLVPDPADLGWSAKRLRAATSYAEALGSDAFMVVDRGILVWEYGRTERNYVVQSCRKSLMGALYGIYHDRGAIDLAITLEELGIDNLPPSLTAEEKQATVEQLLLVLRLLDAKVFSPRAEYQRCRVLPPFQNLGTRAGTRER